jgi:hypothetical protein
MRKIILISDSKQFTKMATALEKQFNEEEPVFLVGYFTHSVNYAELIETSR